MTRGANNGNLETIETHTKIQHGVVLFRNLHTFHRLYLTAKPQQTKQAPIPVYSDREIT